MIWLVVSLQYGRVMEGNKKSFSDIVAQRVLCRLFPDIVR